MPSAAYREWLTLPEGTIEDILEARSYANAKGIYDRAKTQEDIPSGEMFDWVKHLDLEIAGEEMQRKVREAEARG